MFTISLQLFSLLLLFTTRTAPLYNPTDQVLLDCGSSSTTTFDRKWDGDYHSVYVPSNITTASFSSSPHYLDPSVPRTPYSTARIFNSSSFTYTFPVSEGPKFLRLYFYPATYSGLNANQSFFSVSSNGYSLLTNFSAFLTASFLVQYGSTQVPYFVKEFLIQVKDTQNLNVMFTPSPNSYAFINGIEVVSMPENLYFNAKAPKYVNQLTGPGIDNDSALENIYRLNMGGGSTPNYTAPEIVYQTQRSMDNMADLHNLTWILPVDYGFYYMLHLHFCNIIPQYTGKNNVVFRIFINNQTVEQEADLFYWTQVLVRKKRANPCSTTDDVKLPSDRCRRFTLQEVKTATNEFNDNCSIGSGGFGKVYKGCVDNTTTIIVVKRLNPSSSQGFHEFQTEIALLSRLRHVHLVSMIGYCEDKGEMVRDEQVNLTEWGKTCYGNGNLLEIIDPKLNGEIAPGCLTKFGEVASSCLHDEGSERPAMEEVVWGLEFALELQEAAEKQDGHDETMPENQEIPFLM
ncbi:hypothetical protein L1987_46822 [Smallanthus sonchifolius]|uniref:Uncharacterized protein n=1 Tax=Smallanthus sonchifolius TaxID=185202 RepID=A0ACB9G0I6_9ASTR|nr:hypothetical protein L1987_46822 [Smallanthus sonchifolius]